MKTIYVDNAATTRLSDVAYEAMKPMMQEIYGNPSSLHHIGQIAKEHLDDARARVAKCINANPNEIYFTSVGSEADNQAILTAAYNGAKRGKKHIISSKFEHHAVLHTLDKLKKEGFEIQLLDVYNNGIVKVDDVKTTVSNKNNSNKGNTEKKENTSSKKDNSSKTNTSDNDKKPASKPSNSSSNNQKPAKPSNSSSNNQKPAKPSESSKTETPTAKPKQKVWVDDYKTVHHDGYWKVVGIHEEPVYGWVSYDVCNDCGKKFSDAVQMDDHLNWEMDNGGRGSYHTEEEYVQTGTKTVEDKEWVKPWDEKVKDGGHWEYR